MTSHRFSTSSGKSQGSTAFDPQSALPSPRKLPNHEQRRESLDTRTSCSGRAVSPMSSINVPYKPKDPQGWPNLARVMSETPEFAAFSKFSELNTKNLLYYQVQLKNLEQQIFKAEEEETVDTDRYPQLAEDAGGSYHELLMQLRKLLHEYNEAILQYSRVCELSGPESFNLRALRSWLKNENGGDFHVCDKLGPDKTWGDPRRAEPTLSLRAHMWEVVKALVWAKPPPNAKFDLVVTHPPKKADGLTQWVVYYLVPFWWAIEDRWEERKASKSCHVDEEKTNETPPQTPEPETTDPYDRPRTKTYDTMQSLSEATALRLTSALSTVVACLVPVVAIAVLTKVSGQTGTRDLLLCITGFAVVFAVLLIVLTQGTASRIDIFAATAAFSAVLVVFISQPVINVQTSPGTDPPVITP